jgi:hypothetical protein
MYSTWQLTQESATGQVLVHSFPVLPLDRLIKLQLGHTSDPSRLFAMMFAKFTTLFLLSKYLANIHNGFLRIRRILHPPPPALVL